MWSSSGVINEPGTQSRGPWMITFLDLRLVRKSMVWKTMFTAHTKILWTETPFAVILFKVVNGKQKTDHLNLKFWLQSFTITNTKINIANVWISWILTIVIVKVYWGAIKKHCPLQNVYASCLLVVIILWQLHVKAEKWMWTKWKFESVWRSNQEELSTTDCLCFLPCRHQK